MSEQSDFSFTSEWWKNLQSKRKEEQETAAVRIKAACAPLSKLGVISATWTYDGYGDSGDVEDTSYTTAQGAAITDAELAQSSKAQLTDEEQLLLDSDTLREAVLTLLPGGFEINDGSYGEVTLDVLTQKITIGHNERYTESKYSEEEF